MDASPAWDWSSVSKGVPSEDAASPAAAESAAQPDPMTTKDEARETGPDTNSYDDPPTAQTPPRRREFYGSRTCRICLETEEPKFPEPPSSAFGIATESSKPTYVSDDPELGRLLSPCKCKGSQKYVHEGCLNAWRLANPHATRNFWQCPTCKFTYQMRRLRWAAVLSSKITQLFLTMIVSIVAIFILGWIADPILDLWLDPFGTITETVTSVVRDVEAREPVYQSPPSTWDEQFLKGFLSLGIIGFFKTVFILTPWDWLNLRGTGILRGGRRGGGRNRLDNTNYIMVLVGAITFLMAIWRVVKALSARVLKKMSDRVLDVGEDDEDGSDDAAEARKNQ
ncbi:hypothetical protein NLU13_8392 [Sarocladium strictum]|uniref:RING-CH-type domain-containing protein n=1 Tax=Sarocladium strictum TaxID=5046 RepID=A0AA39L560_SARSR|nr:hypothetical protein NLU13_8392 [Sarocladium strictum]